MTSRERILAVLRHQKPDRIPWVPNMDYWYEVNRRRDSLPKEFQEFELEDIARNINACIWGRTYEAVYKAKRSRVKVHKKTQNGNIYTIYNTPMGSLYQKDMVRGFGETPFLMEYMIKSKNDLRIARYIVEDTTYHPDYSKFFEREKLIGSDGVVMAVLPRSPLQQVLIEFMGLEKAFLALHDCTREVEGFMGVIEKKTREAYCIAAESPVKVIWGPENIDGSITSPKLFERYCVPWFNNIGELLHKRDKIFMIHMDGMLRSLLSLVRDTNIDAVEGVTPLPMGDVEVTEVRTIWKDKIVIQGGIPISMVLRGISTQKLKKYLISLLRAIAPGDNFILAMGDSVPVDTDFKLVETISKVIKDYGEYPIKSENLPN